MSKKHTIEYVRNLFDKKGWELLETDYVNNRTKMKYRCSCGHIDSIRLYDLKWKKECSGSTHFSYNYVFNYFKENGCYLLEKEYKSANIVMKYKCKCGNTSKIKFHNFMDGQRCRECSGYKKLTFEFVADYFKNNGCEVLEKTYKNSSMPMKYKCKCGNISKIKFAHFKAGSRCKKCGTKKISGENNYKWNGGINKRTGAIMILLSKWRKDIYLENNYTCQRCFKRGGELNAHHIESFDKNKTLRYDPNNGMTLCKKCHREFHKIFGFGANNSSQLNKYIQSYQSNGSPKNVHLATLTADSSPITLPGVSDNLTTGTS